MADIPLQNLLVALAVTTAAGLATGFGSLLVFASKDHEFFATVGGQLRQDNDPAVIDRLWNPFIAAWYTGKDDPKLRLLRFDPGMGELWQNSSSLLAGIKMLLGADPKRDFQEDVAKVCLGKG